MPPEELLSVANDFVVRQNWDEGFATAIHLAVDLDTGELRVWRAGHPPAAVFHGGSGSWSVLEKSIGPALGLVPAPVYRCDEAVIGQWRDELRPYLEPAALPRQLLVVEAFPRTDSGKLDRRRLAEWAAQPGRS